MMAPVDRILKLERFVARQMWFMNASGSNAVNEFDVSYYLAVGVRADIQKRKIA
jgi:hypothetical protein